MTPTSPVTPSRVPTPRPALVEVLGDRTLRPERIAVNAASGDPAGIRPTAAVFVVRRRPIAAHAPADDDAVGIWFGRLGEDAPRRLEPVIPDSDLALDATASSLAYAVHGEGVSTLVIRAVDERGRITPRHSHELTGYVERVVWTPEGGIVALVADPDADAASLGVGKLLAPRSSRLVVDGEGAATGWRRLVHVDPATGEARVHSPANLTVWEFALVPGGATIAICGSEPSENSWYNPSLVRFPAAANLDAPGSDYEVLHQPDQHQAGRQLSSPAVSEDGRLVAVVTGWASDRGLLAGEPLVLDALTGATVARPVLDTDVTSLSWRVAPGADPETGALWFAGWRGLGTAWGHVTDITADRPRVTLIHEDAGCLNSAWHPWVAPVPGGVLTVRATPTEPPEVCLLPLPEGDSATPGSGSARSPWTALNAGLGPRSGMRVSSLTWSSADGTRVEGLLAVPDGPSAGGWPLVVDIHGGPSLAHHHDWELGWAELLVNAGYAVLMPNPRGGAGRGQPFARGNLGDPAGAEFEDVLAGVRRCVELGVASRERVAAMGASYGGYLTAWAVARGAVRCGVVIAGIANLTSARGTANNPAFYDILLGGAPHQAAALYAERSPVTRVGPGSSPALLLHGAVDTCVPVGQARELYRALRDTGKEALLVAYPGEGHHVTEPSHVRDQRSRVLAWLARWLGDSPDRPT